MRLNKHGLTFDDMGTPMEDESQEDVYLYEDGKFTDIECPLNLPPDGTMVEWAQAITKAGYSPSACFGDVEEPYLTIWAIDNLQADCDYPYFLEFNCLWEGRIIFFKKWHHVTHFINTHGAILTNLLLADIKESIKYLEIMFTDRDNND